MKNTKLLKAKCKLTDRKYCFEMLQKGSEWKAVNMISLTSEEAEIICSEIREKQYASNENLLPCPGCGSRILGSCKCAKKRHSCSVSMPYQFDCAYCSELVWDYSRSVVKGKSPYTKWAGISNIPGALKDKYGNPQGNQYDLAEDSSFNGEKIVILSLCPEIIPHWPDAKKALEKKGFQVVIHNELLSPSALRQELHNACQLWIISNRTLSFHEELYNVVKDFFNEGHGLYVWGDNDPYNCDANFILHRLFRSRLQGDYEGSHILKIQKKENSPGIIPDHLISTGLVSFHEGITIANVTLTQDLRPLIYSSDRKVVTAYYERDGKRALVDGAFTRIYKCSTAGTERFIVNAAAWLANIERFGLQ